MTSTISSLPALLSFNASSATPSATYTLPAASFTAPVRLTLNLCSAPTNFNDSFAIETFTAWTNDSYTYSCSLSGGFGNITVPVTSTAQDLKIRLDSHGSSEYVFELGISDSDTPWHVLDKVPLFAFEDSDNTTALLTSPTYPSNILKQPPDYTPLITSTSFVRGDLSNSSCYIRSLSSLVSNTRIKTSTTTRGVVELTSQEGGAPNETTWGGQRIQYAVVGFQPGTNFSVWGISGNNVNDGRNSGSRLYARQFFATKIAGNCRLMHDVSFCPNLAYSVPAPPSMSTSDLLDLYNKSISPSLEGFSTTLSTWSCKDPIRQAQGMYSRVRNCDQCLAAYTDWLCAVRMPRCTDTNAPTNVSNLYLLNTFARSSPNDSRTSFLPAETFPYNEIPPCIDTCNIVQATCPPLISSAFNCPLKDVTLEQSYWLPFKDQIVFHNVQGGDDPAWLSPTLQKYGPATRAKDRWGNVKCNDLGSIHTVTRRLWSGSTVGSSARPTRAIEGRWLVIFSGTLLFFLAVQI